MALGVDRRESGIQAEDLRRFVDEWGAKGSSILKENSYPLLSPSLDLRGCWKRDLIDFNFIPYEFSSLPSLVNTENGPLNKLMIVLAYSRCEIRQLMSQVMEELSIFAVFGTFPDETILEEGSLQDQFSKLLQNIQTLVILLDRLSSQFLTLLRQTAEIYKTPDTGKDIYSSVRENVSLNSVFETISEALGTFVTVDYVLSSNKQLPHLVTSFSRMIHFAESSQDLFQTTRQQISSMRAKLAAAENSIISPSFFAKALKSAVVSDPGFSNLKNNPVWSERVSAYLKDSCSQLTNRMGPQQLGESMEDSTHLAGNLGLFILLSWMNNVLPVKKPLISQMWSIQLAAPFLPLFCHVGMSPIPFLTLHLPQWALVPPWIKSTPKEAAQEIAKQAALEMRSSLPKIVEGLEARCLVWMATMESAPDFQAAELSRSLKGRLLVYSEYFGIATKLQRAAVKFLALHDQLQFPVLEEHLPWLHKALVLLKSMEATIHRKRAEVALALPHAFRCLHAAVSATLRPIKEAVESEVMATPRTSFMKTLIRKPEEDQALLDSLAALSLGVSLAQGPLSVQRQAILEIILDFLIATKRAQKHEVERLRSTLALSASALSICSLLGSTGGPADCSFALVWSKKLLRPFLDQYLAFQLPAGNMRLTLAAFSDTMRFLEREGRARWQHEIESVENEIENAFSTGVLIPLCKAVEADLKLHLRAMKEAPQSSGAVTNPAKTGVRDLAPFLEQPRIKLSSKFLDVKSFVEDFLSTSFFCQSEAGTRDWKMLEAMSQLARLKYGLHLSLFAVQPSHSRGTPASEQALSAEALIEASACDLHSLEMPGTLSRSPLPSLQEVCDMIAGKLAEISQRLGEDRVQSRLLREMKSFEAERKSASRSKRDKTVLSFGLDRGKKLLKELDALDESALFVATLSALVTAVGKLLGCLRAMKLAEVLSAVSSTGHVALNLSSTEQAVGVAASDAKATFDDLASQVSGVLRDSNPNLLQTLTSLFAVRVSEMLGPHWLAFHALVPPMCVWSIERRVHFQERAASPWREASAETMESNEGFALGLAFLLKVYKQEELVSSLRFFEGCLSMQKKNITFLENLLHLEDGNGMAGLKIWGQNMSGLTPADIAEKLQELQRERARYTETQMLHLSVSTCSCLLC